VSDYREEDFAAEVRHLGGTPEQILADEQMMRTLTPTLRNDSALSEGYCVAADTTLAVPMVMIAAPGHGGSRATLETARSSRFRLAPGGRTGLRCTVASRNRGSHGPWRTLCVDLPGTWGRRSPRRPGSCDGTLNRQSVEKSKAIARVGSR
jgi:hypothetical protein